ncbi:MAG: hypothetical protein HY000_41015 [Planctomycetes bacterium]|nr:hypothetical protein [Planctomycetota bacterium]
MKLAVLSESDADEAAVRIFVEALLGQKTEAVSLSPPIRTRGWPAVAHVLPSVVKKLHYHTDAEALVLVVDSNSDPVHVPQHDQPSCADQRCRLCRLRSLLTNTRRELRSVPGRAALKIAVGLAVPQIEAWYLCGQHPHVTEAAWMQGLESGKRPYTGSWLKQAVSGHDRPSLEEETRLATEYAARLASNLASLQQVFPNGFGALADGVKGWQPAP